MALAKAISLTSNSARVTRWERPNLLILSAFLSSRNRSSSTIFALTQPTEGPRLINCVILLTLSKALAEHFNLSALILCLDTYYAAEQLLERSRPADINWDHPSSIDYKTLVSDLDRLRAGLSIPIREYDYSAHKVIITTNRTEPADIIIIEGALLFVNTEVRERCHYRAFVSAERATRLSRRIARDTLERGQSVSEALDWWERIVEPMYDKFIAPTMNYADVIIPGEEQVDKLADKVLEQLAGLNHQD